jgi:hypothetical protein
MLSPSGTFLIAVPPITTPHAFAENFRNVFHTNNITPLNWYTKLSRYYERVKCFRHWVSPTFEGADRMPIGMSLPPEQTVIRETDFVVDEVDADHQNNDVYCITAIFRAEKPRATFLPPSLQEEVPRDWHIGALCSRVMQEEVAKQGVYIDYYKGELQRAEVYAREQVEMVRKLSAELHDARRPLHAEASTSWRITSLLRALASRLR